MNQQSSTKNILTPRMVTAFKSLIAVTCLLLVLFMLSIICLGSSFGGLGGALSTLGINPNERLGIFANHTISQALEGLIPVERVYVLNDTDIIAPEPDQDAFGSTNDPASLQWLINKAHPRLNGEELFFRTDVPLFKGSEG